jgi:hypothetical protein
MQVRTVVSKVIIAAGALALAVSGYVLHLLYREHKVMGMLDEAVQCRTQEALNRLEAMGPQTVGTLVREAALSRDERRSAVAAHMASFWLVPGAGMDQCRGVSEEESRIALAQLLSRKHSLILAIRALESYEETTPERTFRAQYIGQLAALSGDTELITELATVALRAQHDSTGADVVRALGRAFGWDDGADIKPEALLTTAGALRAILYNAPAGSKTRRAAAYSLMSHATRAEWENLSRDPDEEIAEAARWALEKELFVKELPAAGGLKVKTEGRNEVENWPPGLPPPPPPPLPL